MYYEGNVLFIFHFQTLIILSFSKINNVFFTITQQNLFKHGKNHLKMFEAVQYIEQTPYDNLLT